MELKKIIGRLIKKKQQKNRLIDNQTCLDLQLLSVKPGRGQDVRSPLKSTSPLPSVSNMSMTRCTSGFCWSSGRDMNSSTLREPELSRSSFLNLFPSRLISSASTGKGSRERRSVISRRSRREEPERHPGSTVLPEEGSRRLQLRVALSRLRAAPP